MRFTSILGAAALLTVSTAAAAAPANPAASLSVTRAATPAAKGSSKIGAAVPTATFINIGILAALVAVVLVATGGDDDSDSN